MKLHLPLTRYADQQGFSSAFNPLDDLVLHLEFLRASEYTAEILTQVHGVEPHDATSRALRIGPHIALAISYIEQAGAGPADVSFVSCYYAILNLIKVRLLFTEYAPELPANRIHGASYNPSGPVDRTLPDEAIRVYHSGAIPLFFRALTGRALPSDMVLRMADVYPYIQDIGLEWQLAQSHDSRLVAIRPEPIQAVGGWNVRWFVEGSAAREDLTVDELPALSGCTIDPDFPGPVFRSALKPLPHDLDPNFVVRETLDRRYLFYPKGAATITGVMNDGMPFTEEMPIVLAFYHMASVARYNPELFSQLRASRYWPAIAALRKHGFFKFMLLFWSAIRNAHIEVSR